MEAMIKNDSAVCCSAIGADQIVQRMEQQGVSSREIISAVSAWLKKEYPSFLVDTYPDAVRWATSAMREAGWEFCFHFQAGKEVNKMLAKCPECGCEEVEISLHPIKGEVVLCPDCGAELELISADPIELALAPQPEEDWGE